VWLADAETAGRWAGSDNDLRCVCWEWGDRPLVHDDFEKELYKSSFCNFIAMRYEYLGTFRTSRTRTGARSKWQTPLSDQMSNLCFLFGFSVVGSKY
jgi:hypothetical protein